MLFNRIYNVKNVYKLLRFSKFHHRTYSCTCMNFGSLTLPLQSSYKMRYKHNRGYFRYVTLAATISLSNNDNDEIKITHLPNFDQDNNDFNLFYKKSNDQDWNLSIFPRIFEDDEDDYGLFHSDFKQQDRYNIFNKMHVDDDKLSSKIIHDKNSDDKLMKLEPLWLVLSNTTPLTFGNLYMSVCGFIFLLWKIGDNLKSNSLSDFMFKHFVASYESFSSKRFHTFITSGISHTSFVHLCFNMMMLHQLLNTFNNRMYTYGANYKNPMEEFIKGIFSLFWKGDNLSNDKSRKFGRVTTNDIFNVMLLSSIASSFGHVFLYRTPVLGASGAISGLMYLLASTYPNCYFKSIFPIPGMDLSILQVLQIFIATNCYFIFTGSSRNIAWAAHLIGMNAGALYCLFQQYINKRSGFYNPIILSLKSAKSQWIRTFKGNSYNYTSLILQASASIDKRHM